MFRLIRGMTVLVCALAICALPGLTQQNLPDGPKPKDQSQQQTVPDAPQPKNPNPQNQFPENAPPAPKNAHPEEPAATPTPAPQGQRSAAQNGIATKRDDLYQMSISVNFVQVPVTVKDGSGKLVSGLNSAAQVFYL
jgi:hypothetical protein